MNISYNWLKELIDIDLSPEETAKALTRVGLAVEGIHPHSDDFVLDIDLTSNRPDCLSHLGVARELSVSTEAETRPVGSVPATSSDDAITEVPYPAALAAEVVQIEAPDLCHRFTARIIKGVKIAPSPQWLVDRLEALGERSINNVADITNYVMLELGQPMHAFDLDKLAENRIVVRTAIPGESIKTLDEVDRKLDETMLAICDAEKPVAVAGVMGGFDSGITESTTNVLLEVAFFKRENIRSTSRKLNLATEASYRFERGVDINNLIRASNRAAELICELAGGTAENIIDVYQTRTEPVSVSSQDISAATKRLTGLELSLVDCFQILSALGIVEQEQADDPNRDLRSAVFSVPSWRHDIAIEEDLVEEIARHFGYEKIKDELPPAYGAGEYQPSEYREKRIRSVLSDQGFDEALSYSFIDVKHDDRFETIPDLVNEHLEEPLVTLRDAVIEGAVRMRPTLLPGLLDAVRHNVNHQRRDLKLFEIGKAFSAADDDHLPHERKLFALVLNGNEIFEDRSMPGRPVDFYDAKGALDAALSSVAGIEPVYVADEIRHLRNGQAASVWLDGKKIGTLGRLNEEISADYKFKQPVYVAEIDLQAVLSSKPKEAVYSPLPRFPAVVRDVSFAVGRSINFAEIQRFALSTGKEHLDNVSYVDLYEGKGLDENTRSLTMRFEYRSGLRTLTEEDVDGSHVPLVAAIEEKFAIKQRI